ncbi:Choline-sulfatase [Maioricimonas rarisocia]|uniref:Choline-sulfatase n=1 Tax=Maioricimonas rarisocia TaxID=2528026 RepID=A0A517Z2Z3_9PLAN|nr:sulfatase [Maioricimonas rarisocia]QDU36845.1 Choline-sulfatase [Maioricimonas rarisocia]
MPSLLRSVRRSVVVLLPLFALLHGNLLAAEPPRNVLLIAVDDLRPELGCYGASHAISPNLDRLARQSLLFTNHFVQVPTCGASRYALLTGRSPASSGVTANNHAFYRGSSALKPEQQPAAQSLPELFRRSGYETVSIGKISHTADGRVFAYDGSGVGRDEMPHAWDRQPTPLGPWKRGWGIFFAYSGGRHREDGHGNLDLMEFTVEDDEDLPDGLIAKQAVSELEQFANGDKPFFLAVGFFKPHLPFVAPRQDWDAFENVDIPLPPHPQQPDSPWWHGSGEFFKYDFPFDKTRPLSEEKIRACRRAYFACVRYTDRQIGRVLDALEQSGLAESTIVVLWGDHGWNLGDSRMWAKHTPFERAVRSPLLIHVPGMPTGGRQTDALAESIDIYPTLIDLCRPSFTKTAWPLDGRSLRPVLEDADASVRDSAISYWRNGITVRTQTHRLIATRGKEGFRNVELYDASTGFDPVRNLADDSPEVVEELLMKIR